MSNRNDATEPTLLPYLDSSSRGIAISFSAGEHIPESAIKTFAGSGPYTTLRWGRAVVDGTTSIADLLFLFQSDRYRESASQLMPMTNADVDQHWRTLLRQYEDTPDAMGPRPPFFRIDQEGAYQPMRPLFHCRHINAFLHPLCPQCGQALTLCRDDDLLRKAGLPLYTDSLQRFLYCPTCHASEGERVFYTRSLSANPPDNVRDCRYLIENFSRLLAKTGLSDTLPCIECPQAVECYGPEALALKRMAAFQFYPFYMLVQPAPDIHAIDFINLLSGADPDTLAHQIGLEEDRERWARFSALRPKGVQRSGYLLASDQVDFLEVLYLKLSFLHELYALVTSGGYTPAGTISLEGLWVKLGDQGARLPWLWNFSLKAADPFGRPAQKASDPAVSPMAIQAFLGRAWFYVLLVNPRQNMETVWTAVRNLMSPEEGRDPLGSSADDPVFAAQNIFWTEQPSDLMSDGEALWREAIELGFELTRPEGPSTEGMDDAFESALLALKSDLRKVLFRPTDASAQTRLEPERHKDDRRIGEILDSIAAQWTTVGVKKPVEKPAADPAMETSVLPAGQPNEDGDYEETVILTPDERFVHPTTPVGAQETLKTTLEKTVASESMPPSHESGRIDDTVVIRLPQDAGATDDLDATVALTPRVDPTPPLSPGKPIGIPSTIESRPDDGLERTVVISAPGTAMPPSGQKPNTEAPPPQAPTADDDELEKTVMISVGQAPPRSSEIGPAGASKPSGDPAPPIDEELAETVIIQPRKNKNRKP